MLLYQSLWVQNRIANIPERSLQEVVDFYHRLVAKEAMKFGNRMIRLFRRADDKLGRRTKNSKAKITLAIDDRPARKATKIAAVLRGAPESVPSDATVQSDISNAFEDNCHPVICINIATPLLVGRFQSPYEAAEKLKVAQVAIINCLKEKQGDAFGFTWQYDINGKIANYEYADSEEILEAKVVYESEATIALECLESGGNVCERFTSVHDAAIKIKSTCNQSLSTHDLKKEIYRSCCGLREQYLGVKWRYFDSSSMQCSYDAFGCELVDLLQFE